MAKKISGARCRENGGKFRQKFTALKNELDQTGYEIPFDNDGSRKYVPV
jgi:hypothetical protein